MLRFLAMRGWLCLLSMAVVLLLPLPGMSFCSVPRPRLVCAEYFASQFVVEATLLQTDKDDPVYPSAFVYTLRVNQVLRGTISGTIRVYEGNDSGRAPFDWVEGREYLLFLFYSTSEKSWELDGCGNSGPVSRANKALSEIASIKAARAEGVIHGEVRERRVPANTIAGVQIEAQGAGRFTATTNDKGEFQMKVPAGRYVVRASKNGMLFDRANFSYEDPLMVQIEPGGCAQVEFDELGSPPAR
jgi:Carboxypeptidase regulatory-like domain